MLYLSLYRQCVKLLGYVGNGPDELDTVHGLLVWISLSQQLDITKVSSHSFQFVLSFELPIIKLY